MAHRATPNVRHQTAQDLADSGYSDKEAHTWANSTADAAAEIHKWRAAGYTPAQAQIIYAAADHDPCDWRDLGLPADITTTYVEAGIGYNEAVQYETDGTRPDQDTFNVMKGFNKPVLDAAIREFKAALREDSDFADLDLDY